MVVVKPYTERILNESISLRKFSKNVSQNHLVWHRDREDRTIVVLEGLGWEFQRDNRLPESISAGDRIEVSAGEYHRLIKGSTNLIVTIVKEGKKKKTDFDKGGEESYREKRTARQISKQKKLTIKYNECETEKCRNRVRKKIDRSREKERSDENVTKLEENQLATMINDIAEEIKLDAVLNEIEDQINEKSKKKKKKSGSRKLSKAVKKSLDKKADKRCLTRGSVYSEFRKGLGAYYTSGSRKGMSAHQWAHARVNSAQPSKKWATVKKRKKCPKKK